MAEHLPDRACQPHGNGKRHRLGGYVESPDLTVRVPRTAFAAQLSQYGQRITVDGEVYRISRVSSHPRSPLLTLPHHSGRMTFRARLKGDAEVIALLTRFPQRIGRTMLSLVKQEARGLAVELARTTRPCGVYARARKAGEGAVAKAIGGRVRNAAQWATRHRQAPGAARVKTGDRPAVTLVSRLDYMEEVTTASGIRMELDAAAGRLRLALATSLRAVQQRTQQGLHRRVDRTSRTIASDSSLPSSPGIAASRAAARTAQEWKKPPATCLELEP